MEHLCSTPSSVHEKVGCRLGPSHRTLSISSRPSSAHLSAFSLKNSPLWALILINMMKRPIPTLWCRTLMIRASMSPSGECRRRGSLPSPTQFKATGMSPLESERTAMGWLLVRESSRARNAAANSALPDEPRRLVRRCTDASPDPAAPTSFGIVPVKTCSHSCTAFRTVRGIDNPREVVHIHQA